MTKKIFIEKEILNRMGDWKQFMIPVRCLEMDGMIYLYQGKTNSFSLIKKEIATHFSLESQVVLNDFFLMPVDKVNHLKYLLLNDTLKYRWHEMYVYNMSFIKIVTDLETPSSAYAGDFWDDGVFTTLLPAKYIISKIKIEQFIKNTKIGEVYIYDYNREVEELLLNAKNRELTFIPLTE